MAAGAEFVGLSVREAHQLRMEQCYIMLQKGYIMSGMEFSRQASLALYEECRERRV